MKTFNKENLFWIREPKKAVVSDEEIVIHTEPFTDLWQQTYYGFKNDNAPILQMKTDEKYFSFVVKSKFENKYRFDQCGIAVYIDSENWIKASVEYENKNYQRLGSVVTNDGYSDWSITDIPAFVKEIWYRLSRRNSDFCIEYSIDGVCFRQMRICHLKKCADEISFGVYACSPKDSSFKATFTNMEVIDCQWEACD